MWGGKRDHGPEGVNLPFPEPRSPLVPRTVLEKAPFLEGS